MNNASVRALFCCTYTIPKVLTFVVQAFKMNPFVRYHFKSWILLLDLQKELVKAIKARKKEINKE